MNYYPQYPAYYTYPMPYPGQEYYPMYPAGGPPPGSMDVHQPPPNGGVFFDGTLPPPIMGKASFGGPPMGTKQGFANRKDSADSGISDYSSSYGSRKSSFADSRKSSYTDSRKSSYADSRKSSGSSSIGSSSCREFILEETHLDDVKEEEPYEDPDDDLCEKIVAQVEFYFSDANITKDKFLLKHVKRNKEGFVSLKLISSFKRVKHLTKDWRQVAEAIERKSSKLEVNDLKTKVRRLDALPEYDETTPSRTVVAMNLPMERPTIEAVAEMFSTCGEIVLVRVLRPGNPIPADVKPFANKHPEMTAKVCALIEYERTEFALKAVRELNARKAKDTSDIENENGRNNELEEGDRMVVIELTAPPPKSTKSKEDKSSRKASTASSGSVKNALLPPMSSYNLGQPLAPVRRYSHAGFGQHQQAGSAGAAFPIHTAQDAVSSAPRRKVSLYHNMKFEATGSNGSGIPGVSGNDDDQHAGLNPNAPTFTMHRQQQTNQYQPLRRISRPYLQPYVPPRQALQDGMMQSTVAAHTAQAAAAHAAAMAAHAAYQQHTAAANAAANGVVPPHQLMPFVHRRISNAGTEVASSGLSLPCNVVRLPRGPEKNGKGFTHWCKTRMRHSVDNTTFDAHKKGSHAVPIVAPQPVAPSERKQGITSKPVESQPKPEAAKRGSEPSVTEMPQHDGPVAQRPTSPVRSDNEDDDNGSDSGNDECSFSDTDFIEPSAPHSDSEPPLLPLAVPDEAREEVVAENPGFADNLVMDKEDEKSR